MINVNSARSLALVSSSKPGMSFALATLLSRSFASALLKVAISSGEIGSGTSVTKLRAVDLLAGLLRDELAAPRLEGRVDPFEPRVVLEAEGSSV
jgi:hypothetical protein